jgi:hypothetical protein
MLHIENLKLRKGKNDRSDEGRISRCATDRTEAKSQTASNSASYKKQIFDLKMKNKQMKAELEIQRE